jgi:hypothetical protein
LFNSSKKYIVLLIINIVVLFVLFLNYKDSIVDATEPFDTEYVIGIIEKQEELVKTLSDTKQQLADANEMLVKVQTQLTQTQILANGSAQQFRTCESEKLTIIEDARNQQENSNNSIGACDAEQSEVSMGQAKISSLETIIGELREKLVQAEEDLLLKNQLLNQIQNKDNKQVEALQLENNRLEKALNEPIAIASHYIGARYCEKPRFESLICVKELLVRPSFTKPPITKLGIKVFDKSGNIVAKGEFNSSQAQLFSFSMGHGKELPSGDYLVKYTVDNQTLISKLIELKQ